MAVLVNIALVFLSVSLFLQLVANVTPGWHILTFYFPTEEHSGYTEYDSLFYGVICYINSTKTCEVVSYHDVFNRNVERMTREKVVHTKYVRQHYYNVWSEIEAVVAFVLTILAIIFEINKRRKTVSKLQMALLTISAVSGSILLMVEVLSSNVIFIKYISDDMEQQEEIGVNPAGSQGINYSLIIYGVAALGSIVGLFSTFLYTISDDRNRQNTARNQMTSVNAESLTQEQVH